MKRFIGIVFKLPVVKYPGLKEGKKNKNKTFHAIPHLQCFTKANYTAKSLHAKTSSRKPRANAFTVLPHFQT